jgi:hypothetical protein
MQGFRIVLPAFFGGSLDVKCFLGSPRELSKEAKPPFSELQPGSAFVVGSGPKSALLRLRRVMLVLVLSVHRWLPSGGLAQMWARPIRRPAGADSDSAQARAISNARREYLAAHIAHFSKRATLKIKCFHSSFRVMERTRCGPKWGIRPGELEHPALLEARTASLASAPDLT